MMLRKQIPTYKDFIEFLNQNMCDYSWIIQHFAINVTEFFRDLIPFEYFDNHLFPDLVRQKRQKGERKITIWSAGCSVGAEPYSLAIIIHEFLKNNNLLNEFDVNILATDIDDDAIQEAQNGVFPSYQLKNVPESLFTSYFSLAKGENYKISSTPKSYVQFKFHDLLDEHWEQIDEFDCIFCRNVFIYIRMEDQVSVLQRFYEHLRDDGALILGMSENLPLFDGNLFQIESQNEHVYSKLTKASDRISNIKEIITPLKRSKPILRHRIPVLTPPKPNPPQKRSKKKPRAPVRVPQEKSLEIRPPTIIYQQNSFLPNVVPEIQPNSEPEPVDSSPGLVDPDLSFMRELEALLGHPIPLMARTEWHSIGLVMHERHITHLGIRDRHLSAIPSSIGTLRDLESLVITGCPITQIPDSIQSLENLKELRIPDNQLIDLPNVFGKMRKLRLLVLNNNQLKSLPPSIGYLGDLAYLSLAHNQIKGFPTHIVQLNHLEKLDLSDNEISEIPESIGQLQLLNELKLDGNRLTALPEGICSLKLLQILGVKENQLASLPSEIGNLISLEHLDLKNNGLLKLPQSLGNLALLEYLDVSQNQLSELPESIGNLRWLVFLDVRDNYLSSLPSNLLQLVSLPSLMVDRNLQRNEIVRNLKSQPRWGWV